MASIESEMRLQNHRVEVKGNPVKLQQFSGHNCTFIQVSFNDYFEPKMTEANYGFLVLVKIDSKSRTYFRILDRN